MEIRIDTFKRVTRLKKLKGIKPGSNPSMMKVDEKVTLQLVRAIFK